MTRDRSRRGAHTVRGTPLPPPLDNPLYDHVRRSGQRKHAVLGATVAPGAPAHCLTSTPYLGERRYTHACVWRVGRGRQSHFIHRQSTMGRIRSDKWCQFIIYKAVREARGRRRHPKLHGPFYIFQLVPTLGPSTCSTNPAWSTHTTARITPFY